MREEQLLILRYADEISDEALARLWRNCASRAQDAFDQMLIIQDIYEKRGKNLTGFDIHEAALIVDQARDLTLPGEEEGKFV